MSDQGPDLDAQLARAELLVSLGRHEDALRTLGEVVQDEPSCYALCLTAQSLLQLDRPAAARDAAEAASRVDPGAEWPLRLLSIALRELGEPERAVEMAAESVRREPQLWEPRAILAIALSDLKGSRHRARRVAQSAVSLAPHEAQTHFVSGLMADRLGRQADAESAYRRALRLNPQHAAARNNLSVILSRRGDYLGAARGFTEAAAGDPRLDIARQNVDYVVIRLLQRAQLVVLATVFAALAGPRLLQLDSPWVSFAAALAGVAVIGVSVLRFRRSTPRRLHSYLRTLPARDPLATVWVALLSAALAALLAASWATGPLRWWGIAVSVGCLVVGWVLGLVRTSGRRRRPRPQRS